MEVLRAQLQNTVNKVMQCKLPAVCDSVNTVFTDLLSVRTLNSFLMDSRRLFIDHRYMVCSQMAVGPANLSVVICHLPESH